ncbi:MAG: FAD-dependent oxidoreductase, partial [Bacteroidales bacterium]|nr:FAD-dependent oxidoreductase [Bacteroidales bacterium]
MKNCSAEKRQKVDEIRDIYPQINDLDISDCISDNITLSTMHGCPPEEIEKIGLYLLRDKKLNTNIKLNPTLLGETKLREILSDSGFKTNVPDIAFEHDLKYDDAVKIIHNLQKEATRQQLHFGLKLTNTLESKNHKPVFPPNEKMMYMSGTALHPISVNLAAKLQQDFNGELSISFSGGVNAENISSVLACGLSPATVCSDILKPGGYSLLGQYLGNIQNETEKYQAGSLSEFSINKAGINEYKKAALANLTQYANEVLTNPAYRRKGWNDPTIKTARKLKPFDCVQAPCVDTCPTNQDIPDYMYHTAHGDFDKAFEVIMRTNPFPNTTGMVCDHLCQSRCTRINYDGSLLIREIKRFVAEEVSTNKNRPIRTSKPLGKKVAIFGAGPSGLSAAYFLAIAGMEVEIFEIKDKPGGMVSGAIPEFRLTNEAFEKDINRIVSLGIKIHYSSHITASDFEQIRKIYHFVYIAIGASISRKFTIKGIGAEGVLDPLEFLFAVKQGKKTSLGRNVLIIGGGNTAMDAARTAYRMVGKCGKVSIVYRRTKKEMPADLGEIKAVQEEGVEIMEKVLPIKVNTNNERICSVTCVRMKLIPSNNGRPQPVVIPGSEFDLEADTLIPAIGQDMDIAFLDKGLLQSQAGVYETKIPGMFIGGDALRGASTAINAIGDGRKVSRLILTKAGTSPDFLELRKRQKTDIRALMTKRSFKIRAVLVEETPLSERKDFQLVTTTLKREDAIKEASRCLQCDEVCNTCVTVCPNLALYQYSVESVKLDLQKIKTINGKSTIINDHPFEIKQTPQILHIADWCNECGNCNTFCPTADAP